MKNKTDELVALLKFDLYNQISSVVCVTETWLGEGDDVSFDIFGLIEMCHQARTKMAGYA